MPNFFKIKQFSPILALTYRFCSRFLVFASTQFSKRPLPKLVIKPWEQCSADSLVIEGWYFTLSLISAATRVMIFSQYRDSVQEITDMLTKHRPLVKSMSFIGQASAGKNTKGFTQKEQLKVCSRMFILGFHWLFKAYSVGSLKGQQDCISL